MTGTIAHTPHTRHTPRSRRIVLQRGVRAGLALALPMPLLAGFSAPAADYPPSSEDMQGFAPADPPFPAPDVAFYDVAGASVTFAAFRGQALLVNFWATWCAPCIREMPGLERLSLARGGNDFQLLAMSQDRQGAAVAEPFLRDRLGLDHITLTLDPKVVLGRALGVTVLPSSFLIDRAGTVRGLLRGPAEWDSPGALELIDWLIRV